jgi:hypothetical protein
MLRRAALVALFVLAGCGDDEPARSPLALPDHPGRDEMLSDPRGQIDLLTAGGHLVAWTIRTPADVVPEQEPEQLPIRLPSATTIVIADEHTGGTVKVAATRPWVQTMRMFTDRDGAQLLALRTCVARRRSSCAVEVLSLDERGRVRARTRGDDADVDSRRDRGRTLTLSGRRCDATLRLDGRELPRVPLPDPKEWRCDRLLDPLLVGRYALVTARWSDPHYDFGDDYVYAIDVDADTRWRAVARPAGIYDEGDYSYSLGPATSGRALVWETIDETDRTQALVRLALPPARAPAESRPVALRGTEDACAIAATERAVYELAGPRCAGSPFAGRAVIRRLVPAN